MKKRFSQIDVHEIDLARVMDAIIAQKDSSMRLNQIEKFSVKYIVNIIGYDKVGELYRKFLLYNPKGVDVIEFVKILLSLIKHEESDTV